MLELRVFINSYVFFFLNVKSFQIEDPLCTLIFLIFLLGDHSSVSVQSLISVLLVESESHLSVSRGVRLRSEEERDIGGKVSCPTEGIRTKSEAKHASLAGLGHSASLYSWKYFDIQFE